jgi:hypothetical protein
MIGGMEIALAICGIYMLATGRTMGKDKVAHWQFRLLGGFLLTLFPLLLVVGATIGIVYALQHPGITADQIKDALRWQLIGVEAAIAVLYVLVAVFWEKSIRKKALAAAAAADQAFIDQSQPPTEPPGA